MLRRNTGVGMRTRVNDAYIFSSSKLESTKTRIAENETLNADILTSNNDILDDQVGTISQSEEEEEEVSKMTPKVLNAFLLVACFGFVTYSILNVDQGMTRGWTITEKAMRIPLDNWASYESSLNTQPVVTKTAINVVIYLLGDWLSQTLFIKKNMLEFDAVRTMRNGLIGLIFGPLVHEYYEFSDAILPVDVGINRLYKILMDQTIYIFIKCNMYIVAVNFLAGESLEYSTNMAKEKIKDVMFTAWKFWPLVHCITYGAIPARHRILWVNCVDLFWNAILALKTSGAGDEDEELLVLMDGHNSHLTMNNTAIEVHTNGDDSRKAMDISKQVNANNVQMNTANNSSIEFEVSVKEREAVLAAILSSSQTDEKEERDVEPISSIRTSKTMEMRK